MKDLQLVESCNPPEMGNALHVEESLSPSARVFMCIAQTASDPARAEAYIPLDTSQVIALRDWLTELLKNESR